MTPPIIWTVNVTRGELCVLTKFGITHEVECERVGLPAVQREAHDENGENRESVLAELASETMRVNK